jgi:elongation factor Ts
MINKLIKSSKTIIGRLFMSSITIELIQLLRERTGLGILDCKKALIETNGDIEKSVEMLRKKGVLLAEKRGMNSTSQGIIYAYIHSGSKIGVLVEINCETDFVANTDVIKHFAREVALQVVAMNPKSVSEADIDQSLIKKEEEIYREQLKNEKKPAGIIDSIVLGKIKKFYAENCLLNQLSIKNDKMTIKDLLQEVIGKVGENVRVNKFIRYQIGG